MKNFVLFSGIRARLILIFFVALVPIMLLIGYNVREQRVRALEQASEKADAIFRFAVMNEQRLLTEARELLERLSTDPNVVGGGDCGSYLSSLLPIHPRFINFGLIRADGYLACSAVPFEGPLFMGDRSYFRGVVESKSFTIGEYLVGRITGRPLITFGHPVFDERKALAGVVFAGLDLSYVTEFDAEVSGMLPYGSTFIKVDSGGTVIGGIPGSSMYRIGEPIESSVFQTIDRGKTGSFISVDSDGVERLHLYSSLWGTLYGDEAIVLLGIPTDALLSESGKELERSFGILALVAAATVILLWRGGERFVIEPVTRVVEAAGRLARGDLSARADLPREKGEIGHLARVFDDMACALEKNSKDLSEVRSRLAQILAASPAVIYAYRLPPAGSGEGGCPVFLSERIKDLLGYEAGEVLGETGWATMNAHPEDATAATDRTELLESGRASVEYRMRTKGGEYRWVLDQRVLVRDAGGAPYEVVGSLTDITDRKKAEEDLVRLVMAVEQAAEGFVVSGADWVVEYVNPAFEKITGYSSSEVVGRDIRSVDDGRQENPYHAEAEEFIRKGQAWKGRRVGRRKDGAVYTEDAVISPVRDRAGTIVKVVASIRDVTQEVLLQKQLQVAQRMEAVGTLAGGIAHDFNNTLTGVFGFTEIALAKAGGNEEVVANLMEARRCADRAAMLTRQLLAYSRRQVINPVNLDLNAVVTDLAKLMEKIVGAQIRIRTVLGKGIPTVFADVGQLEQVLMNLVVNARDAMPSGGGLLIETGVMDADEGYVARYPFMKAGRYVVLSVADTGTGMDEKTMERAFDPFFSTKGPDKGTGLGLAMVYGIVKQHKGYINLDSELGKGTVFRIFLPPVDAPPDAVAAPGVAAVPGGKETVLVAEDDEAVRTLVKMTLEELGYSVLSASGGEEAVAILEETRGAVSLALLDVVMPKMGGKEAYKAMLRISPGLKVLFMSGYADAAAHESPALLPPVPLLDKPFTPTELARKVREVLNVPA